MENNENTPKIKKRKISDEARDSKRYFKNINNNLNKDEARANNSRGNRYSLFVQNIVNSQRIKSLEKRKREAKNIKEKENEKNIKEKEEEKNTEKEKEKENNLDKKTTYKEKFQRSGKPKETFQSTSKNPKINEILQKLRESEESKNTSGNNNVHVGKIDFNLINIFMGKKNNKANDDENNIYEPKVKNYVDKLNKILRERTKSEGNNKKQVLKIKKNKKEIILIDDNHKKNDNSSSSLSEDEYEEIRGDKIKRKKYYNNQIMQEDNCNTFYISGNHQEKYLNQKSNINYSNFSFKSMKIKDNIYKKNKKSKTIEYIPKNQTSFSILCEQLKKNEKSTYSNFVNSIKLHYIKSNKNKMKRKRTTEDSIETERNLKNKYFDIHGFDRKKRKMSIYDILKKRNISIISEEPLSNRSRISRSIKLVNKQRSKEMKIIKEQPKIHKYNEMVKYIIYSTVSTIKKVKGFDLKDLKISKIENFDLIIKEKPKEINTKPKNNTMIIKKENDIEIYAYKKKKTNSIHRNKNSFHKKNSDNKHLKINTNSFSLTDRTNNNKPVSNIKTSINVENKTKVNKKLSINKYTFAKKNSKKKQNKSTERRQIKSSILFGESSSLSEEDENEAIKDEDEKREIKEKKPIKIYQYDNLLLNYPTNTGSENKTKKISKNIDENSTSIVKHKLFIKENISNNKTENKYLYTDKDINETRSLLKRKLRTNNKLLNEEMTSSKKEINKVKMSEVKIKKFKSKNLLAEKHTNSEIKKNNNLKNKKYVVKTAKIKQFHKHRNYNTNILNNSNITLQNTIVNHNTYNYYLNDQEKLSSIKGNIFSKNRK